jgi:hypothetical protein
MVGYVEPHISITSQAIRAAHSQKRPLDDTVAHWAFIVAVVTRARTSTHVALGLTSGHGDFVLLVSIRSIVILESSYALLSAVRERFFEHHGYNALGILIVIDCCDYNTKKTTAFRVLEWGCAQRHCSRVLLYFFS